MFEKKEFFLNKLDYKLYQMKTLFWNRYNLYIDCMPVEHLSNIEDEFYENIQSKALSTSGVLKAGQISELSVYIAVWSFEEKVLCCLSFIHVAFKFFWRVSLVSKHNFKVFSQVIIQFATHSD